MSRVRNFIISERPNQGDLIRLSGAEFHHLNVSRVRVGERIKLLNGHGGIYDAEVISIGPDEARLEIQAYEKVGVPGTIDMALALIKAPRMVIAVEKCSELGVRKIIPYISERGVWRGGEEGVRRKRERLERKVIAACKQSGQPYFPEVSPVLDFGALLGAIPAYSGVYLADQGGGWLETVPSDSESCRVLGVVGPEGGLSDAERSEIIEMGAIPVSLAPFRLRSETAAICLLHQLSLRSPTPK